MTGYFCPVEGCDKHTDAWDDEQPPFASREAVRSHINAMSGDDHQRARDEGVWKEAPSSSEGTDGEGVENSDEQQPEGAKSSNEQAESSSEGDQPAPSSSDTTDESSDDQGDEQVKPADGTDPWSPGEQPNDQQTGGPQEASSGGSTPSTSPSFGGPSLRTTALLIGATVAIAVVIVLWRRRRSGSIDVDSADPSPDDEDESTGNGIDRESGGGLR